MTIEILTDKLVAQEITREEFLREVAKLNVTKTSVDNHDDAYSYVLEALNVHREPDPRVMVDLLAFLLVKIEDQTGYVPNPKAFDNFGIKLLEDVLQLVSVLKKPDVLFPTRKRSKNKYSIGGKENLGVNAYIFEYLFNLPQDVTPALSPEDF